MIDLPTLDHLEGLLREASGPDRELDALIAVAFSGDLDAWAHSIFEPVPGWWRDGRDTSHLASEVTASIDAIVSLIEAALPGWGVLMAISAARTVVSVHSKPLGDPTGMWPGHAEAPTAPLALCLALVSALKNTPDLLKAARAGMEEKNHG